jgi:hypothetical protein
MIMNSKLIYLSVLFLLCQCKLLQNIRINIKFPVQKTQEHNEYFEQFANFIIHKITPFFK